ncbi:MAG: 30S ribosomal protein S4 [Patescibacteria group bacterium]
MRVPTEKRERALGERLHLKGHRCDSPKCAAVRRPYRPGVHGPGGRGRKAPSDFGRQLVEKQKVKVVYGIDEKNLRRLFEIAKESKTGTSMKLLELLERRLDNVMYRLGLASSRREGHQVILHGHVNVNGKRVRSPGFQVPDGGVVSVREDVRGKSIFKEMTKNLEKFSPPGWLELDINKLEGKVVRTPQVEESVFEINLLVEAFSK